MRTRAGDVVLNDPVPGKSGALHLTNLETRDYSRKNVEEDGSFSFSLEPGRYLVKINAPSSSDRHLLHEALDVGEGGLSDDVVLPGARVRGVVSDGSSAYTPSKYSHSSVSLYGNPSIGPTFSGRIESDGTYLVDGVAAGSYLVKTWPRKLPEDLRIVVGEAQLEVLLDLELIP